jgi:hypothetical protein
MAEDKLTLTSPDQIVVRMYGQGFGDCFLLALPRTQADDTVNLNDPVYVLIDSGVYYLTPRERERMRNVATSVHAATGGVIDLLVATHEHQDHLSGFEYAKDEWKQIAVRNVWVAWTEDASHPSTIEYDHEKEALKQLALAAHAVITAERDAGATHVSSGLVAELRHIDALAGFVGDDWQPEAPADEQDGAGDAPFAARGGGPLTRPPRKLSKLPQAVLYDLANEPGKRFNPAVKTERFFCEPGQVLVVPGTAIDAYVLGPPTDASLLSLDMDESEVYSAQHRPKGSTGDEPVPLWQSFMLASASSRAERLSIGSALERHADAVTTDLNVPFGQTRSISYDAARHDPFFKQHYFDLPAEQRIDDDWLRGVSRLSLQLDKLTNNTSLALAFRLPDGRVLLFVGDAQVGNWLSWHRIEPKQWHRPQGGDVAYRPTATQLLERTVVYKVGHHGSHNATLRTLGLEQMPDGLIAFIPISRRIPHLEWDDPWDIPLPSLLERLVFKSGGRVVLSYDEGDIANGYVSTAFASQIERAEEMLPPMERRNDAGDLETIEDPVPLWRQVRL